MKKDLNGAVVPTWGSFSTCKVTLAAGDTFEALDIPANAAEVILESDGYFTYGESLSATGSKPVDYVHLQVLDMLQMFLKGSAGQEIYITWGLL